MKRTIHLLIFFCLSMLGAVKLAEALQVSGDPSVSISQTGFVTQHPELSQQDFWMNLPQATIEQTSPTDIDQQDEDELLRKQNVLIRCVLAFFCAFLLLYPFRSRTRISFLHLFSAAAAPLYIRLRVIRI